LQRSRSKRKSDSRKPLLRLNNRLKCRPRLPPNNLDSITYSTEMKLGGISDDPKPWWCLSQGFLFCPGTIRHHRGTEENPITCSVEEQRSEPIAHAVLRVLSVSGCLCGEKSPASAASACTYMSLNTIMVRCKDNLRHQTKFPYSLISQRGKSCNDDNYSQAFWRSYPAPQCPHGPNKVVGPLS
jgi:hypothetical protein